mgnify:CR=1 FL=1
MSVALACAFLPPGLLWGSEEHVRGLFGDAVSSLDLTRTEYVERSPGGPEEYCEFFKTTFGPAIAILFLRPRWRAETADGIPYCPACGYDLRASRERCPECGAGVELARV